MRVLSSKIKYVLYVRNNYRPTRNRVLDGSIYGRNLANTIKRSVHGVNHVATITVATCHHCSVADIIGICCYLCRYLMVGTPQLLTSSSISMT